MRNLDWCRCVRLKTALLLFGAMACTAPFAASQTDVPPLRGLQVVEDSLIHFDPTRRMVGETPDWGAGEGLRLRLSKSVYPYEDEHIDAVVFLDPQWGEVPTGRLRVEWIGPQDDVLSEAFVSRVNGAVLFFSFDFPDKEVGTEAHTLRVRWQSDTGIDQVTEASFRIAEPLGLPSSGQIAIRIPNDSGAALQAAPMTVGVPFPRGVLKDVSQLRLIDAQGKELPVQAEVTSRWSRYGSIRWILANFTVDLDGAPAEVILEYGPDSAPSAAAANQQMRVVALQGGFPAVDGGRLRIDNSGVRYRFEEGGEYQLVLPRAALTGGFVEHENGRMYVMPADTEIVIESQGSENVVLRAEGWYQTKDGRDRFCQFVTRYVLHRDTPGLRIFHTWIFTGDGNRDRIFDMGWRFALDEGMEPVGFLPSVEGDTEWITGEYLLQFDHNGFEVVGKDTEILLEGERAPGVFAAAAPDGPGVVVGSRDFWQNFPSELSFDQGAMTFHNWPLRGKTAEELDRSDGFPGTEGSGWADGWLLDGVDAESIDRIFAVEKQSTVSPNSDTALTIVQQGDIRQINLARQIAPEGGLDPSQPHSIGFYLRADDLSAMQASTSVWLRLNSTDGAFQINSRDHRWWVGARRLGDEIHWQVRDGGRDGGDPVSQDTGIVLREGGVYYFQFDIDPQAGSYDFSLYDREGGSFKAEDLGFRGGSKTGGMFLNFNQQKPLEAEVLEAPLAVTLSDIRVWEQGKQDAPHAVARFKHGRTDDSRWTIPVHLWFAHSGDVLDFRMPADFAEDPIYRQMSSNRSAEFHWAKGQPETANAQGIARTEEIFVHFTPGKPQANEQARLYAGFNNETFRAIVDPVWVAASGTFYEVHHRDVEKYPEEERIFELVADAPARWAERLGLYGMWAYGDTMWGPDLNERTTSLYRAFRKSHQGWPYSWVPYARSGEPRLLRYADAATRQMTDAYYSHYFDEAVEESVGPDYFRQKGWWYRSLLPWAGRKGPVTRSYQSKVDFLWSAYYLTGYARAKDVALDWGEQVKVEQELDYRGRIGAARPSVTLLKSFVEMYEATFDPWYLISAQEIARMHQVVWHLPEASQWHVASHIRQRAGHFWSTGDREYLRFTGDEDFLKYYIGYATAWAQPRNFSFGWPIHGASLIEPAGYGYLVTGDDRFLQRMAHFLEFPEMAIIDEGSEHFLGYYGRDAGSVALPLFTGWYLQHFPHALAILEKARGYPDKVIPSPFYQRAADIEEVVIDGKRHYRYKAPVVAVQKNEGEGLPLLLDVMGIGRYAAEDEMWSYLIHGPDQAVYLQGEWFAGEEFMIEIPAEAPAGTYRLEVAGIHSRSPNSYGRAGLIIPVSSPGHPEVLVLAEGEAMGRGFWESQYWFLVPEGVESFVIDIPIEPPLFFVRRMSLWNADGERVWNHQFEAREYDGVSPIRVEVNVPAEQAGRLWRLTLPGRNAGFMMDPQIPPFYSTSADRWFRP